VAFAAGFVAAEIVLFSEEPEGSLVPAIPALAGIFIFCPTVNRSVFKPLAVGVLLRSRHAAWRVW